MVFKKFFWSFINIRNTYPTRYLQGGHPWDVVRNNHIISDFLKSDCDIFVKMDVDQIYPQNFFEAMVPLVDQYKVIGPLIFDRWAQNSFMPLAFDKVNENKFPLRGCNIMKGIHEIPFPHTNLFYAREVVEKLKPPYYEAHLREDGLDRANHVDYTFLQKIKDAGYPIYINSDVVVAHIAVEGVSLDFYRRWNKV